ncbi:MAG: hypothetical protein LBC48_01220 [Dysgonamonadaceae bacterium]|jgi:hypothetical protein|nr:hypothetical protein [Dysgonamonadaceae bacterium]
MKDKITTSLSGDKLEHHSEMKFPQIHVIDFTERTKSARKLEIYDTKPDGIDTLLIENPNLNISATFFKPQCFLDEGGKEPDNCEGVFYLSNSNEQTWVLFVEIKDCKAKNISEYFDNTKKQVISVVQIFRDKGIISLQKKVYANISFPRRNKTDFYQQLIKDGEPKEFRDKYKIIIRGTNHLKIKNEQTIY